MLRNKKGLSWPSALFILLISLVLIFMIIVIIDIPNSKCLHKIAMRVCEGDGGELKRMIYNNFGTDPTFICLDDRVEKQLHFTDREKESCK